MAKTKEQQLIQVKYAFTFNCLLEQNKVYNIENSTHLTKPKFKIATLGQLSSDTGLRPATLSDIFLGRSNIKAFSIDLILQSLEKSYTDFAEIFDRITEKQIIDFKLKIDKKNSKRKKQKK